MQSIDLEVLQTARDWQQAGHRIWLVTVAETFGASPRPPGSLLVIRDDGMLVGSVSGGCIEDDLVLRLVRGDETKSGGLRPDAAGGPEGISDSPPANREQYSQRQPVMASYGVTSEEARRFGLPCGGTLDVLIEAAVPASDIGALLARISSGEIVARHVDLATGTWTLERARPGAETTRGDAVFTAIHGPRWRMLVIGASEIARYLADMAAPLDFQVFVCDPREEYRASWRVPGTAFIEGMPDDAVTAFRPDGHTVILTVSHDPKLDDMALLTALKSDAFYVGAVGSRQTTADRKARLAEHFGLTQAELARLRGPVGLPIGSRTPPEIAIAILADLVAARNRVLLARVDSATSAAPALKRAS